MVLLFWNQTNAQHFCISNTTGWGDFTCVTSTATKATVAVAGLTTCHRLARVALSADHSFGATDCAIGLQSPGGRKIWLHAGSGWAGGLPDVCKTYCDFSAAGTANAVDDGNTSSNSCATFRPDGTASTWAFLNVGGCNTDFAPTYCSLTDLTQDTVSCSTIGSLANLNGNWTLVLFDTWGGGAGNGAQAWLTFDQVPDLAPGCSATILPLAPGTCVPTTPLLCPAVSTACAPFAGSTTNPCGAGIGVAGAFTANNTAYVLATNPPIIEYAFTTGRPACVFDLPAFSVCPATGITFPAAGTYNIVWRSRYTNSCIADYKYETVTVADTEAPTFPNCPKGGKVTLNAGPGECGAFWNAPAMMAMDNCPSALIFGELSSAPSCSSTSVNFCGINACGDSGGFFFNVRNSSTCPIMINGFASWFTSNGTPSTAGTYEVYYRTAANTGWNVGHSGGFCTAAAPKSNWTLCKLQQQRIVYALHRGEVELQGYQKILYGLENHLL
ncbi:MAG: hypothetical protein IPL98_00955 [Saprospiraceae bacterium]|nr:hypothetical protein [Saprospiraceae bacterium]